MRIGKTRQEKENWAGVDEREEDSVIGPRRVVDVDGPDGFKFKVWDRLRSEFKFSDDGAKAKSQEPTLPPLFIDGCILRYLFIILFCYYFVTCYLCFFYFFVKLN